MKSARKEFDLSVLSCDPCRFSGKNSIAMKYCKDCNGHFCTYCAKDHIKATPTKYHSLIDVDKKRSGKSSSRIQERCHDHSAALTGYCETHEQLCCNVCQITAHKECVNITKFSEADLGKRAFRMCKDLELAIKRLQNKFEEVQVQKQEYIKSLENQNEAISSAIRLFRKSINGILNKLEEAVIKRKDEYCKERTERVQDHVKTSQTAITVLNDAYRQLDLTVKGSDTQVFVNSKRVQSIVQKYTEVLARVQPMPEKEVIRYIPDIAIEKFLGDLTELGELKIDIVQTSREYTPSINSSRQGTTDNRRPNFTADIKVRLKSDKKACYITGATFLFDGRVVLADESNKCVKLFGADFKPLTAISLESSPRDITTISHSEVCATLPNEKLIQMFQIGPKELERTKSFGLDMECYGITFHETDLYVTSGWSTDREIHVIKPTGEFIKKIKLPKGVFRYPLYITIDPKSQIIYVSDYINGIIGVTMDGKILNQYRDEDIGTYYKGVTLTTTGQIYVCTWQQNGVQRVHTDGKGLETVLTWKTSERRKPLVVAYTSKTKRLILTFCGDKRDVLSIYKFY